MGIEKKVRDSTHSVSAALKNAARSEKIILLNIVDDAERLEDLEVPPALAALVPGAALLLQELTYISGTISPQNGIIKVSH